jgi:hypothetical protein
MKIIAFYDRRKVVRESVAGRAHKKVYQVGYKLCTYLTLLSLALATQWAMGTFEKPYLLSYNFVICSFPAYFGLFYKYPEHYIIHIALAIQCE